jgi:hypothetical protein
MSSALEDDGEAGERATSSQRMFGGSIWKDDNGDLDSRAVREIDLSVRKLRDEGEIRDVCSSKVGSVTLS